MTQAKRGDTVRINYTGRLADGTTFDTSEGREPLQFTLGAGQVITGLENRLEGMEVGSKDTVTIPADEAYGPRSEEAVQTVARTQLPKDIDVAIGTQLQARTPEGRVIPLTVVAADDNVVQLDANHPLAGKDLVFDVELVEIVQAA
jgi:peptidylprolyl isomerase